MLYALEVATHILQLLLRCSADEIPLPTSSPPVGAQLAERGKFSTALNPWVGCVIVGADGETVLAEGFHQRKGGPHAEAAALANAKARGVPRSEMSGATAYVTLEPCHGGPGKTTPPCDEALVASGIPHVHLALLDPDPAFGGGAAYLRSQGVRVTVGAAAAAVRASLRPYLHQRLTGMPWVVLKVASATDGSIGCVDGTSQWITGPEARAHGQGLRAASQAIIIGSGTALTDRPRLTRRGDEARPSWLPRGWLLPEQPLLRVVLDARGQLREGPLLDTSLAPTLVFTTSAAPPAARAAWDAAGVEACEVPATSTEEDAGGDGGNRGRGGGDGGGAGGVALEAVLRELASRGVVQAMVEGGGLLHGAFLHSAGLAQQLRLYVGATALGSTAPRWIRAPLAVTITEAPRWKLLGVETLGDDVCLEYLLGPAAAAAIAAGEE